jgi:probable O-glycosylation ligase (exosortase A-associated)
MSAMSVPTANGSVPSILFVGYLFVLAIEYLGLAGDFPILKTMRAASLISYALLTIVILRVGVSQLFASRQTKLIAGFVVLTGLSVFWAYVQTYAVDSIRPIVDYLTLTLLTMALVDRPSRLEKLALLFSAVAVVLLLRNLSHLGNAARMGSFHAGYFMGDGNDFAWGMNVIMPIVLGLVIAQRRLIPRLIGIVGFGSCVLGMIATQSRGGTLGFAAAMLYGWWFVATRRVLGAIAVIVVVAGIAIVAPAGYATRVNSIGNYQQDNSAQARLQVWGVAIQMAVDHPLGVGAGNFNTAYGRRYMPAQADNRIAWANQRWLSAHSIFFKILGEYGFPGLVLLFCILGANLMDNVRTRKCLRSFEAPTLAQQWPALLNMGIVAYAVSGIFLGGFAYPHLFLLTGLTLALKRLVGHAAPPDLASSHMAPIRPQAAFARNSQRTTATGAPVVDARIRRPSQTRRRVPERR